AAAAASYFRCRWGAHGAPNAFIACGCVACSVGAGGLPKRLLCFRGAPSVGGRRRVRVRAGWRAPSAGSSTRCGWCPGRCGVCLQQPLCRWKANIFAAGEAGGKRESAAARIPCALRGGTGASRDALPRQTCAAHGTNPARAGSTTPGTSALSNQFALTGKRRLRNSRRGFLSERHGVRTASPPLSRSEHQTSMPAYFTRMVQGGERRRGLEEAWLGRRRVTFYSAVGPLRPGVRNLALGGFEVPELHFGQPLAHFFCNPFGLRGH
ncbi:hypothetical protein TraAM80_10500, partial [Trypanosoma rangeli]